MQLSAKSSSVLTYRHFKRGLKLLQSRHTTTGSSYAATAQSRLNATSSLSSGSLASAMDPPHARKPVVTAIIRRESDGKLLLVKRSDQVGTYQQYWGGVSGGVEGNESLLRRALQEISEEVGLSPQQLQLVTCGRPLPVDDGRRHFLIYPFLFTLLDSSAAITLNWENVGFDWVAPSAVPQLQHVPLLPETVRRLLLPPYMAQHVQYLKDNRSHGAAELATYVLQALRSCLAYEERSVHYPWIMQQPPAKPAPAASTAAAASTADAATPAEQQQPHEATFEHWMEAYTNFCFLMAVARPSMAAVANAAADVMLQLHRNLEARAEPFEPTTGCARLAMSDALDKLEASMQQQRVATINNTAAVLKSGMRVLTTSLSSTVAKAISQAHQQALSEAAAAAGTPGDSSAAADADATAQPQPATQQAPATTPAAAGRDAGAAQEQQQQGTQQQPAVLPGTVAQQDPADDLDDDRNYFPPSSGIGWEPYSSSLPPWLLGGPSSAGGSSSSFKGSSRGPGLSVIVCESRPLCEGVAMAQRLAAAGLQVTAITDAQAGVFVEEADVVLLGADAVTPAGVVNKVGSKLLALAAKAASVPVVAVTDSLKITPGPVSEFALPNTVLQVGEEEKDVSELLSAWGQDVATAVSRMEVSPQQQQQQQQGSEQQQQQPGGTSSSGAAGGSGGHMQAHADASALAPGGSIELRNVYFETVPLRLVSAVITDKGIMAQVAAAMAVRSQGYHEAFGLEVPVDMLSGLD